MQSKRFWIIFVCILSIVGILRIVFGYLAEPIMFGKADFTVLYVAADYAIDHKLIYGNAEMYEHIVQLRGAKGAVRYLYPPTALLIFLPIQKLPFSGAVWLWLVLSIGLTLSSIYLLSRAVDTAWSWRDWAGILGVLLVFTPWFTSLRSGQVNILLLFLFVLQLWLLKRKKYHWVGAVIAGMMLIKLFPIVLLLYYLLKKQWRVVTSSIMSVCVLVLLSITLFGIQPHQAYVQKIPDRIFSGIHPEGITRHNNMTLNAVIHRIYLLNEQMTVNTLRSQIEKTKLVMSNTDLQPAKYIHYAIVIPLLILLVLLTWRTRQLKSKNSALETIIEQSIWLSFVLFAAKDAHSEYLVLLLPLLIMLLTRAPDWAKLWSVQTAVYISLALMTLGEIMLLPYVQQPDLLYVLPLSFFGNVVILSLVSCKYFLSTRRFAKANNLYLTHN